MKKVLILSLLHISCQALLAQKRYEDSLYQVKEVQTVVYATKAGEELEIGLYRLEKMTDEDLR